jgi:RNA polymerase sigma factor (sigma-70 family)
MNRPTDELDSKIDMERILAALPPQQRRAVSLYARGYTQAEIARKFGVSQQAISACFVAIRKKLLVFYA